MECLNKIKLIYHDKYQHYYTPLMIDQDAQTIQMIIKTGKNDRTVKRDAIVHSDDLPGWKFIIMRNKHISAEDNFLRSFAVAGEYKRKMREIADFKRNGLQDSERAMDELIRLYQIGFDSVKSKEDYTLRKAIQRLYNALCCPSKDDRRATYDQHIPGEIRDLARSKGLFIERVDEVYYDHDGRQRRANKQLQQSIRSQRDCGYLIRNGRGEILIGDGHQLTDQAVCEFVQAYVPQPDDKGNYKIPLTQQEEKKFRFCRKVLMKNGLRWKNKNNIKFWVLDQHNQVIYGGNQGVGLKNLHRWCVEFSKGNREQQVALVTKNSAHPKIKNIETQ